MHEKQKKKKKTHLRQEFHEIILNHCTLFFPLLLTLYFCKMLVQNSLCGFHYVLLGWWGSGLKTTTLVCPSDNLGKESSGHSEALRLGTEPWKCRMKEEVVPVSLRGVPRALVPASPVCSARGAGSQRSPGALSLHLMVGNTVHEIYTIILEHWGQRICF